MTSDDAGSGNPILKTKLTIPRPRRNIVARSRLVEVLNRPDQTALTLISAPAGSGKTTLLTDWADTKTGGSVAWLSLDPEDDRYDTFWTYVIASVQTVAPEIGAAALALLGRTASPEQALITLLNDLTSVGIDVDLVLDDFHVISSVEVHGSLTYFVDHLPQNVRVVISSRSDPALPLARLRARGELTELRVSELRFTEEEATTYLTDRMGIPLTAGQVSALEKRTEGWAAALQLAAVSMRGVDDVSTFISDFAGTGRYVVDYLVEEVLDRQSEGVRDFLLQTSILNHLTGPLCDEVTGRNDSATTLRELERDNLLIVPLDASRRWYRYHHLFSDVLRAHLHSEHPGLVETLHRRASDWFESVGDSSEAIQHALAAQDYEHAADLVEWAVPAMRRSRDEATMLKWYEALPSDLFEHRPVLAIGYVGGLLASGSPEGVEDLLRSIDSWIERDAMGTATGMGVANREDLRRLPSATALYRSALSLTKGDTDSAISHARRALELAGHDQHLERGGAAGLLALTHWTRGDLDAAFDSWAQALESLDRAGHYSDMAGCSISMADIRSSQGRLGEALAIYENGLGLATRGKRVERGAADMHVGIGEIHRERNDLASARRHLRAAQELGVEKGLPQNLYRARLLEGRIREAEADLDGAIGLLAEAEQVYFTDFSPDVRPVAAVKARLHLRAGQLTEARLWAERSRLSIDDAPNYLQEFSHLTLARVLLAGVEEDDKGRTQQAITEFLLRLLNSAEAGGRTANVIEILVVLALARRSSGDTRTAVATLNRALVLAEPEGFARIFLDEGDRIAPLLEQVAALEDAPTQARLILEGLKTPPVAVGGRTLVDPLTERELAVLRLLGTDMSGPDIAGELYVSLNTLRTHTKHIYLKLGVGNRRAAVRRAAELDLL